MQSWQKFVLWSALIHRDVWLTFVVESSASPSWPKAFKDFLTSAVCADGIFFFSCNVVCSEEKRVWCTVRFAALTDLLSDLGLVFRTARLALQDWRRVSRIGGFVLESGWSSHSQYHRVSCKCVVMTVPIVSDVPVCPLAPKIAWSS